MHVPEKTKCMTSEGGEPRLKLCSPKSCLYFFLTVQPQENIFVSLCFRALIYKIG